MNLDEIAQTEGDHILIKGEWSKTMTTQNYNEIYTYFAKVLEPVAKDVKETTAYATTEAVSNAIWYGKGIVEIRYWFSDKLFKVSIKDQGDGFDVNDWKAWCNSVEIKRAANEHGLDSVGQYPGASSIRGGKSGLGLFLIHKFMDSVEFNERGNEITLYKNFH